VSILPVKFYGVVAYGPYVDQLGIRGRDKPLAGAVALAESAGAISTQVRFWIVPHMAIVPNDSYDGSRFEMIDFGWKSASHSP
jgi:hypothetical protein